MAYGVRYFINWKARTDDDLCINILKKDYAGISSELRGAGSPCVIPYENGDEKIITAFKTSKCEIAFFNDGFSPLSSFYSEDAEAWLIELRDGSDDSLRWAGYLSNPDSREAFQDAPYEVKLVATDNLGLLKELSYDVVALGKIVDTQIRPGVVFSGVLRFDNIYFDPKLLPGDLVYIDGVGYELTDPVYTQNLHHIASHTTPTIPDGAYDVTILVRDNLIAKNTLFSFLELALRASGIVLPLRIFNTLYETNHDITKDMFSQTRIFTGKWLDQDGVWGNIYDILKEILDTFDATLLQADGFWNVVRFGEMYRFTDNKLTGFEFDTDFKNPVPVTLEPNYDLIETPAPSTVPGNVFIGADAEVSILPPFKFVKETFHYQQPRELIRNLNLRELGDLIRSYADGLFTVKEYEIPYWELALSDADTEPPDPPEMFIRVIFENATELESDRYIVLKGGTYGGPYLRSSSFYMDLKDRVKVTFQVRTSDSQAGASTNPFIFRIVTAANAKYKYAYQQAGQQDGIWKTTNAAVFSYTSTEDLMNWTSFDSESLGAPVEGYFDIALQQLDFSGTINETHYKAFNVEYIPYITDSTQITGHTHTQLQDPNIKNNYDEEIAIDDSPKHALQGALFTDTIIGRGYDQLTSLWKLKQDDTYKKLGEVITNERMAIQNIIRTLIEGTFTMDCPLITPLNVIFISSVPSLNFIFGVCSFDFMAMQTNCKLWELHKTDDLAYGGSIYTFRYLYKTN